jgi:hypothetical protein
MRMHLLRNRPTSQDAAPTGHMAAAKPPPPQPRSVSRAAGCPFAGHQEGHTPPLAPTSASRSPPPAGCGQPAARPHMHSPDQARQPPCAAISPSRGAVCAARRLCCVHAWPAGPNPRAPMAAPLPAPAAPLNLWRACEHARAQDVRSSSLAGLAGAWAGAAPGAPLRALACAQARRLHLAAPRRSGAPLAGPRRGRAVRRSSRSCSQAGAAASPAARPRWRPRRAAPAARRPAATPAAAPSPPWRSTERPARAARPAGQPGRRRSAALRAAALQTCAMRVRRALPERTRLRCPPPLWLPLWSRR